jgi:hypothetical protein
VTDHGSRGSVDPKHSSAIGAGNLKYLFLTFRHINPELYALRAYFDRRRRELAVRGSIPKASVAQDKITTWILKQ